MAECSSCHQPITWAQARDSGKKIPLDPQPTPTGNIVRVGMVDGRTPLVVFLKKGQSTPNPRYRSHFVTCPNREQHRRPAPKRDAERPSRRDLAQLGGDPTLW